VLQEYLSIEGIPPLVKRMIAAICPGACRGAVQTTGLLFIVPRRQAWRARVCTGCDVDADEALDVHSVYFGFAQNDGFWSWVWREKRRAVGRHALLACEAMLDQGTTGMLIKLAVLPLCQIRCVAL
jgi:hypothetical protein